MSHKSRWQARFEGYDGASRGIADEVERRIRNIKRSRLAASEVADEDKQIEQRLGLRVR